MSVRVRAAEGSEDVFNIYFCLLIGGFNTELLKLNEKVWSMAFPNKTFKLRGAV